MIVKTWAFQSESNPSKPPYETQMHDDGNLSCNCDGWTKRFKANGGVRTCRHVRLVEQGIADQYAVSVWKNPQFTGGVAVSSPAPVRQEPVQAKSAKKLGVLTRKVNWNRMAA